VAQNDNALKDATEVFRDDWEVVIAAFEANEEELQFASGT